MVHKNALQRRFFPSLGLSYLILLNVEPYTLTKSGITPLSFRGRKDERVRRSAKEEGKAQHHKYEVRSQTSDNEGRLFGRQKRAITSAKVI